MRATAVCLPNSLAAQAEKVRSFGAARLAPTAEALGGLLAETYRERGGSPAPVVNPFGAGDSGRRIVTSLLNALAERTISSGVS